MEQLTAVARQEAGFFTWLSNDFVIVRDGVLRRIGDIRQKSYSFRSSPFATGTKITFMIKRLSEPFLNSLTFGITVYSPDRLDGWQDLEASDFESVLNETANYNVANHFVRTPQEKQIICLMRTSVGVVMSTETELGTIGERLLFRVDPYLRLFPFFLFDGCVEAIQLNEF